MVLDIGLILRARGRIFKVDYHQVMSELSAQEVATRLGIKLDTVYAYVSRGALSARRVPGSRRSVFDADEVEKLARRGRPRRTSRPSALDLVVETDLTTIIDHRIAYRGRDIADMARTQTFEQVANWLWTGIDETPVTPWEPYQMSLPELAHPRDRIRAAVVIGSASQPLRSDLSTPAVTATAQALIASMVAAVPAGPEDGAARTVSAARHPPVRDSIARRLWTRLTVRRPVTGLVASLNAALVLLADHELASSTVAARIAASVRADPFSVVLSGLGTLAGPLHGSASGLAHQMIADAIQRGPEPALAAALETHQHLPGFGHRLYPEGDPRAKLLFDMIRAEARASPALSAADALIDQARRHSRIEPNIDLALAALATAAHMPATAGETIFTISRTAGWIAHAIEEYTEAPVRFRARAIRKGGRTD
jgi:citrate synthase